MPFSLFFYFLSRIEAQNVKDVKQSSRGVAAGHSRQAP
jgi:hypothetical protein